MIQKNTTIFVFSQLILLSITQLLCHSQKILKAPGSSQDFLIDTNNASKVNQDTLNTELPEEFTNADTTILKGNVLGLDVNPADGSQKFNVIPNSGEFGESKDTNSFIRLFPDKGGMDSEAYVENLDKTRSSDPNNFKVSEKVMPIYPKTVTDEIEKNNQKSNSSPEKLENGHESVSNLLWANPYHIQVNTEEWQRNFLSTFMETGNNGENSLPYMEPIKLKAETPDITGDKNKIYPMRQDVMFGISSATTASNLVPLQNNNKLLDKNEITSGNGDHHLQYAQPVKLKGKSLGMLNETKKPPIQDNNKKLGISFSSTKSPVAALQDNDELKYNNEITNSNNTILNRMWNGKYTYDPEKTHEKTDFLRDLRQEKKYVDFEREDKNVKRHSPTVNRDIKSNQETQASVKPDEMKESPRVNNVNNTVKGDALKMLKNNRTQNLLNEQKFKECEKGSDACLKCREISPYCHYNYRSKLCFYANVVHGNAIYECGVRFFTSDGYMPFFIAVSILIVCSLIVLFFLARAFYRHILQKDPITNMEVDDVRNIVHLIREKRSMQKKLLKRIGQLRREVVVDELERLVKTDEEK